MELEDEELLLPLTAMTYDLTQRFGGAPTDLRPCGTHVLDIKDRQNDLAIREFVPRDCHDFTWMKDRQIFSGRCENVTRTPGPTFPMTGRTRIVEIVYKIIDNDFIVRICIETNRYANQILNC